MCVTWEVAEHLETYDLGRLRNIRKSQIWVETEPSAQSPIQKLNFDNSSQKVPKVDTKVFYSCSILLDFLILFQIFCTRSKLLQDDKFFSIEIRN